MALRAETMIVENKKSLVVWNKLFISFIPRKNRLKNSLTGPVIETGSPDCRSGALSSKPIIGQNNFSSESSKCDISAVHFFIFGSFQVYFSLEYFVDVNNLEL